MTGRAELPVGVRRAPTTRTARRSATPRRMCACSPLRPWQRSTAHSFSARKRRPSAGPYSLRRQRVLGVGGAQVLRHQAERRAQVLRPRAPEQRAVHRRQHPLVGVDDERVGAARRPRTPSGTRGRPSPSRRRRRRRAASAPPPAPRAADRRHADPPRSTQSCRRSPRPQPRRTDRRAPRPTSGPSASTGTVRSSIPSIRAALATDECACRRARPRRSGRWRAGRRSAPPASRSRRCPRCARASRAGSPSRSRHPVEHHALELGGRGRGAPQDRHRVQRRRQQLGEDRRLGGAGGEVGEVARVLPVGDARQQHSFF